MRFFRGADESVYTEVAKCRRDKDGAFVVAGPHANEPDAQITLTIWKLFGHALEDYS